MSTYEVSLKIFEGPLDLLLHLIQKDEIEITDIPIAKILDQYMEYLHILEMLDLDIAGEFLVMASKLMFIKSKMLLPADTAEDEDDIDPRQDLMAQLLEYKKFKEAAAFLEDQEEGQSGLFPRGLDDRSSLGKKDIVYKVSLFDLVGAFSNVLKQSTQEIFYEITEEEVSVEGRIADIIEALKIELEVSFESLFNNSSSRVFIVATFLAILELIRLNEILAIQKNPFEPILICQNGSVLVQTENTFGEK